MVEAARALVLSEGIAGFSMDAVAERAHVTKATVYACFGSREALLAATLDLLARHLIPVVDDAEVLVGRPEAALAGFATWLLRALTRPEALATYRVWAAESGRDAKASAMFEAHALEPVAKALVRYLKEESARGTLNVREPRLAAAQFLGLIKEPLFWPYVLGSRSLVFRLNETVRSACRVFLSAYR